MKFSIAFPLGILLSISPACKSHREHFWQAEPKGIEGGFTPQITAAWMSDGSLATFEDTYPVEGVPAKAKLFGIMKDDFECIPDHRVGVGRLTVPGDAVGYEGEAEWVIRFPEPISQYLNSTPDSLAKLKLRVHGLIEGKALSRLGDAKDIKWASGCVGNNVITSGPGFTGTLYELREKKTAGRLNLTATFFTGGQPLTLPDKRKVQRTARFADKEVQDLLAPERFHKLVTTLAKYANDPKAPPALKSLRLLNLSALGDECAAVNNKDYQTPAMLQSVAKAAITFWRMLPPNDRLRDMTRSATVDNVVKARDALPAAGGTIVLDFTHTHGRDPERAVLRVQGSSGGTGN